MGDGEVSVPAFESVVEDIFAATGHGDEAKTAVKEAAAPFTKEGRVEYRGFAAEAVRSQRLAGLSVQG